LTSEESANGDGVDATGPLTIFAEIVTSAGAFVSPNLLQRFTLRFVSEAFATLRLTTQSGGSSSSPPSSEQLEGEKEGVHKAATAQPLVRRRRDVSDRFVYLSHVVPSIASLAHALLLVCRPTPTPLLALGSALTGMMHSGAPVSALPTLHLIRGVLSLITMPTPLPWYLPPSDAVVSSASSVVSLGAPHASSSHHNASSLSHHTKPVTPKLQPMMSGGVPKGIPPPPVAPTTVSSHPSSNQHPAMASPRIQPAAAVTLKTELPQQRKRSRSQPQNANVSPRLRETSKSTPMAAARSSSTIQQQPLVAGQMEDDIPDIVLD